MVSACRGMAAIPPSGVGPAPPLTRGVARSDFLDRHGLSQHTWRPGAGFFNPILGNSASRSATTVGLRLGSRHAEDALDHFAVVRSSDRVVQLLEREALDEVG